MNWIIFILHPSEKRGQARIFSEPHLFFGNDIRENASQSPFFAFVYCPGASSFPIPTTEILA